MATQLVHSKITEIPNTEPAATPALWNTRYTEIDENFNRLASFHPVGTSSTAAATAAKTVTINGFSLATNSFVLVKFSAANSAASPTLNVSGTGAKAIYFNGSAVPASYLEANKYYRFVYDGAHWILTGDVDVRHLYLPLTGGTISGALAVTGATTLTGKLAANGGVTTKALVATSLDLNGNGDVSGSLTVHGDLNAQGGLSVTDITATGTTTVVGLNAGNVSASGTLAVNGTTTMTGKLMANGGIATKALSATSITNSGAMTNTGNLTVNGSTTLKSLTATGLDLNGNGDVSGTLAVHGKTTLEDAQVNGNLVVGEGLQVTGSSSLSGGATVKTPENYVKTNDVVPASWVWALMQRYGLGCGMNEGVDAADLFPSRDFDDINVTGFYTVGSMWANSPMGASSQTVTGILLHVQRRYNSEPTAWQILVDKTFLGTIHYRLKKSTGWDAWVAVAKDSDVVHVSGNEVIAGKKEFSDNVQLSGYAVRQIFKNIGINKGEIPSESQEILLRLVGGDGSTVVANTFSELELCAHNSGDTYVRLWASKNVDGSSDRDYLEIRYDKIKDRFTTRAPHPVTDSNDNSIATTKWTRDLLLTAVPTGTILPFAGKTVPSGFLLCNGAAVSRTTYAALFAVIGTTWGTGNGSSTFNLPDLRNRHFQGANDTSGVGTYLEAGLPNITGRHGGHAYKSDDHNDQEGVFHGMDTKHGGAGATTNCDVWNIGFDASLSSSIYGASETVQPPSVVGLYIVKI